MKLDGIKSDRYLIIMIPQEEHKGLGTDPTAIDEYALKAAKTRASRETETQYSVIPTDSTLYTSALESIQKEYAMIRGSVDVLNRENVHIRITLSDPDNSYTPEENTTEQIFRLVLRRKKTDLLN